MSRIVHTAIIDNGQPVDCMRLSDPHFVTNKPTTLAVRLGVNRRALNRYDSGQTDLFDYVPAVIATSDKPDSNGEIHKTDVALDFLSSDAARPANGARHFMLDMSEVADTVQMVPLLVRADCMGQLMTIQRNACKMYDRYYSCFDRDGEYIQEALGIHPNDIILAGAKLDVYLRW